MAAAKKAAAPKAKNQSAEALGRSRTTCKTCSGHGATDVVASSGRNAESHYNKYGNNLKLGLTSKTGENMLGANCTSCEGSGWGN